MTILVTTCRCERDALDGEDSTDQHMEWIYFFLPCLLIIGYKKEVTIHYFVIVVIKCKRVEIF